MKHLIEQGSGFWPTAALILCMTIFVIALLLALFGRKERHDHMAHLPLEDDKESQR
jgi:cbb3-type cytochrome oxidase subunit 3